MKFRSLSIVFILMYVVPCLAADAPFSKWVDRYLDDFYRRHPSVASQDGIHDYDDHLDSYSSKAVAEELASLKSFEKQLADSRAGVAAAPFATDKLSASDQIDAQLVQNNILWRRLELERIRAWEKNPGFYSDVASNGLMWLALYEYASPEIRLRHIISREKEIPRVLAEAKTNIKNPPAVFCDVGLGSLQGTLSFVQSDVPKAFASVKDPKLIADFRSSTAEASKAISDYMIYVKEVLQPNAKGDFAIGAQNYSDKLKYQEGIDTPLDQLLAIAKREIDSYHEQFRATAAQIDPAVQPMAVWSKLKHDHPPAGGLVVAAQKQLDTLVEFIEKKGVVTIPKAAPVLVAPTPGFMRWSFASMWVPGPFETADLRSPYYITDVDPAWTDEQKEEHLTEFNYPQLWTTSIHEAYPGHYVQGLYVKNAPSRVRKAGIFAPGTYTEGWAHYCEQMMIVDEGLGGTDPKYHMGQIMDALLRLCRYYVGIKLHTGGMSLEEGIQFFMDNGYMERGPSETEAKRGTYDPTYLVYSVGKLEILKLREDYRKLKGAEFSLHDFHDRMLQGGNAPIWVYRKTLLGSADDGKLLN